MEKIKAVWATADPVIKIGLIVAVSLIVIEMGVGVPEFDVNR